MKEPVKDTIPGHLFLKAELAEDHCSLQLSSLGSEALGGSTVSSPSLTLRAFDDQAIPVSSRLPGHLLGDSAPRSGISYLS